MNEEKALRYNESKLQWALLDIPVLENEIRVLEFGMRKYAKNNWKKGLSVEKAIESTLRHTVAILQGQDIDPESGLPHTSHIRCNAMFIEWTLKNKPEFDDRYEKAKKESN